MRSLKSNWQPASCLFAAPSTYAARQLQARTTGDQAVLGLSHQTSKIAHLSWSRGLSSRTVIKQNARFNFEPASNSRNVVDRDISL